MSYALIKDGQVSVYPYSIAEFCQENPNVSLPQSPTTAQLEEQGIYEVYPTQQPPYNAITQNCTEGTPELTDGQWIQVWVVTEASPEEIAANEAAARQANKTHAESMLQATDWAATVDITNPQYSNPYLGNQDAFLAYRSDVRKIAVNPPIVVDVWPVKPDEVWVTV